MAAFYQQFGSRLDYPSNHVKEVSISSIERHIANLTSLVHQMATGHVQNMCNIRLDVRHTFLPKGPCKQAYAVIFMVNHRLWDLFEQTTYMKHVSIFQIEPNVQVHVANDIY